MAIFTIIGSVIGAGFASGQEIYLFFFKYGFFGILGLLICSFLISYIIYKVLKIVYVKNVDTYAEFLNKIFRGNISNSKYFNLSYINNIIVNIFLLFTFFIMVAGFAAYFSQEFGQSHILGALFIAFFAYVVFRTDVKGLTKINSFIVPILICFIVCLGLKNIPNIQMDKIDFEYKYGISWVKKSIIYASYNIILLVPVLVSLKNYIKNKKNIFWISFFSGVIFFTLSVCVFFLLVNVDVSFDTLEMPIIYVVKKIFPEFKVIYGLVILVSIFTTATSIGMSFLENVCRNERSYAHVARIMCISGLFFCNFGFSNMVKFLFPVFGCLGLGQIFLIAIYIY